MLVSTESQETTITTMTTFDQQVEAARQWFTSPRFDGIVRLYSPRQVAEQQGTISGDYSVARRAAEEFYPRLRELFAQRKQITTFGPYSPGQAVMMKRMGMEGIYLGGWAVSARGSGSGPGQLSAQPGARRGRRTGARASHRRQEPALRAHEDDRRSAQGDPSYRLSPFHHRRRRHRSRWRRACAQSDPPHGRGRVARLPHRRSEAGSEEV